MATTPLQPGAAPANADPVVEAYLRAREMEDTVDRTPGTSQADKKFTSFAYVGAIDGVMRWRIWSPQHAALAALVAAEQVSNLIEAHMAGGLDGADGTITVDVGFRNEIDRLQTALVRIWEFHHENGTPDLLPLAEKMGFANPLRFAGEA